MDGDLKPGHFPDGLTEEVIDALLREAWGYWPSAPRPSRALLDGSAASRRDRRMARRAVGAVVRVLPVVRVVPDDREAA